VKWTFEVATMARVHNFDLNMGHGSAFANSDYGHTINWGGITSVVDADTGEPDTDWTVESASGFDYSQPVQVPEPASVLLAAIGCVASLAIARR
jgi:PEP-CTERM motif